LVSALRPSRWQRRLVVPLLGAESRARRVGFRADSHADASVGHLVSPQWPTTQLHSGIPHQGLAVNRQELPFHCRIAECGIEEGTCWGNLGVDGHAISWRLRFTSHFGTILSNKGWIGFSSSPHSDAVFSGEITLDGQRCAGEPLGYGLQGHNCGYRHRSYWRWAHAYLGRPGRQASTFEALVYDLPFGMVFRKAVLWHEGEATIFRKLKEREVVREDGKTDVEFRLRGCERHTPRNDDRRYSARGSSVALYEDGWLRNVSRVKRKSGAGTSEDRGHGSSGDRRRSGPGNARTLRCDGKQSGSRTLRRQALVCLEDDVGSAGAAEPESRRADSGVGWAPAT